MSMTTTETSTPYYWTPEHDEILRANRETMTRKQLALKLGRSHGAIAARLKLLDQQSPAPVNGTAPEEPARIEAEDRPAVRPLLTAIGKLETAILATAAVLEDDIEVATWDKGDVFHALYLMLYCRDRLAGLEQ